MRLDSEANQGFAATRPGSEAPPTLAASPALPVAGMLPPPALPGEDHHVDEHEHRVTRGDWLRVALMAVCAATGSIQWWAPLAAFEWLALAAVLVGGYPIFREALRAVVQRRMTMELSMTIALAAACAIGEFHTALFIALFVVLAELLEKMTLQRGRMALRSLLDLLPPQVTVRRGEELLEIAVSELKEAELVVVRPGGRIAVDGVVESGHSAVDQAAITGESLPVEKVPGSEVYAGTINQVGVLEVRTTRVGQETAFGKIVLAVEQAERAKAPVQRLADRLAGYLVYAALACALVTFLISRDVRATISVVIVAGACGIAAGTPLAILGAIGQAARLGAVIKGGRYLEALARLDTVVLDKTGTLTLGRPVVSAVCPAEGSSVQETLHWAAVAEKPSEHPLAAAVLAKAREANLTVEDPDHFHYIPGLGVICQASGYRLVVGNRALMQRENISVQAFACDQHAASEVLVARDGSLLGVIRVSDVLRPEAVAAVEQLRRRGLRTVLLTGDADNIAQEVGRHLGVDQIESQLLPEDKLEHVRALVAAGRQVAMVGDGINDAPALAQATVGVAMGSGTDVARESADVVLLSNDLLRLTQTLDVARRAYGIIMQNFWGTLLVDAVGVALAAAGMITPLWAAFIHVVSELTFLLNAARLIPAPRRRDEP